MNTSTADPNRRRRRPYRRWLMWAPTVRATARRSGTVLSDSAAAAVMAGRVAARRTDTAAGPSVCFEALTAATAAAVAVAVGVAASVRMPAVPVRQWLPICGVDRDC